jgi:hypothetical protein
VFIWRQVTVAAHDAQRLCLANRQEVRLKSAGLADLYSIIALFLCIVDYHPSLGRHCVHASRLMAGTRSCGAPKPSLPSTSKPTTLTPQARRTFQESFDSFEQTVRRYSRTDDREFSNTTLRDVRDAAKQVERQLAARQCMRNMKRLEPFLNGLEAYSKVIEVLCNGTPFLSWIWVSCNIWLFDKDCVNI